MKDPVCGMWVDPHTAKHRAEHDGQPYYFCSAGCRTKFMADPARYLDPAVAGGEGRACARGHDLHLPDASRRSARSGPGSCPICGMALEPVLVTRRGRAEPRTDRHDAPVLDRARADAAGGRAGDGRSSDRPRAIYLSQQTSNWIQMVLATPVVLWAGWPFFVRGWQSLVTRNLNMFTLIAMGTGVAWVYSVVATLAPGVFPAAFREPRRRGRGVFRGGGGHHGPRPARAGAGAARPREHERRHPGAPRPRAEDRAPHPQRRDRGGGAARQRACRRPPARAPGREGAGRRRRRRRAQRRRRVDGHRRVDAGDQGARRQGHRRHDEPVRRARHRGAKGRARHHAVADRPARRGSAAQPRADPAPGRPGVRLVRAGGDRRRRCSPSSPGRSGARSRASPTASSRPSRC